MWEIIKAILEHKITSSCCLKNCNAFSTKSASSSSTVVWSMECREGERKIESEKDGGREREREGEERGSERGGERERERM